MYNSRILSGLSWGLTCFLLASQVGSAHVGKDLRALHRRDGEIDCVYHDSVTNTDYDFSILHRNNSVNWHAHDTRDNKRNHFHINVCGPLIHNTETTNPTIECAPGAASCMIKDRSRIHKSHGPTAHPAKSLGVAAPPKMKDQTLYFLYEGGDACRDGKFERQTLLTMRCGPTLGAPVFIQETAECQFQFEWVTSAACGVGRAPDPDACVAYDQDNEIEYNLADLKIEQPWTATYGEQRGGTHTFSLSVCQPLPDTVRCVADAKGVAGAKIGACVVQNFIDSHGVVNDAYTIGDYDDSVRPTVNQGILSLQYTSNQKCPPPLRQSPDAEASENLAKVYIQFVCKHGDIGEPVYVHTSDECTHVFLWESYVACGEAHGDKFDDEFVGDHHGEMTVAQAKGTCELTDPVTNMVYDLNGLTGEIDYIVPDGGGYSYWLQVCRPLRDVRLCEDINTGVCRTHDSSTSSDEVKPLAMGQVLTSELELADGMLSLTYSSDVPCQTQGSDDEFTGQNVTSKIIFNCARKAKDAVGSGPRILSGSTPDECNVVFEWDTPLACGTPTEVSQCVVNNGNTGIQYDFSRLKSTDFDWVANGKSDNISHSLAGKYDYYINVCGAVRNTYATEDCGALTSVCRVSKFGEAAKSLGHVGKPVVEQTGVIKVTYEGGDECRPGRPYVSTITFVCDHGYWRSPPRFVRENVEECTTEFEWLTRAACPPADWIFGPDNCTVQNPYTDYVYDLNGLYRKTGYLTGGDGHFFGIDICGDESTALTGTACQNMTNTAVCETDENALAGHVNRTVGFKNGVLMMTFTGGKECKNGNSRTSTITFVCDRTTHGYPVFVEEEDDCSYYFEWPTAAACPPPHKSQHVCYAVDVESGRMYDLSPLQAHDGDFVAMGGDRDVEFHLSVCGPLQHTPKGCINGTSICSHNPHDESGLGRSEGFFSGAPTVTDGVVSLLYTGGSVCEDVYSVKGKGISSGDVIDLSGVEGDPRAPNVTHASTLITFVCSEGRNGAPVYVGMASGCKHLFEWPTTAVCDQSALEAATGSDCKVRSKNSGHVYDLNSLRSPGDEGYEVTYTGLGKVDGTDSQVGINKGFRLNVCGPLRDGCGDGAKDVAVCVSDVGSAGKEVMAGRQSGEIVEEALGVLTLTLDDGAKCPTRDMRIQTKITFICEKDGNGEVSVGAPTLTTIGECVYEFTWATPLACGVTENAECVAVNEATGAKYDLSPLQNVRFDWVTQKRNFEREMDEVVHIAICRSLLTTDQDQDPLKNCRGNNDVTSAVVEKDDTCHILTQGQTPRPVVLEDGTLSYTMTSLEPCGSEGRNRTVVITFTCFPGTLGFPVSIAKAESECVSYFEWQTEAACEVQLVQGKECALKVPTTNDVIDLKDLWDIKGDYEIESGERTFYLNPCRGIVNINERCPASATDSTGVCQTSTSGGGISPSGEKISTAVSYGVNNDGAIEWNDGLVTMTFVNGSTCEGTNEPHSAEILFTCAQREEIGKPTLISAPDDCAAVFEWPTNKVCEAENSVECVAVDESTGVLYDLSLLGTMDKNWVTVDVTDSGTVDDRNTTQHTHHHKKKRFHLNVCRGLNPISSSGSGGEGDDTHVGMHTAQSCWRHASACLQVDDSAFFNLGKAVAMPTAKNGVMSLRYEHGQPCSSTSGGSTSTLITFTCKRGGLGEPVFVGETDECTYQFVWETSLMCEHKKAEVSKNDDCTLFDKETGTHYDLSSLRSDEGHHVTTYNTHHTYTLNVCAQVAHSMCNKHNVGVCEKDTKVSLGNPNGKLSMINGVLTLVYEGGDACTNSGVDARNKHSIITFICEEGITVGNGFPVALNSPDDCTYLFEWRTPLACSSDTKETMCNVVVENAFEDVEYDLSPLTRADDDWEAIVGGQSETWTYYFNVCKPLAKQHADCPASSAVCRVREKNGIVSKTENLGNPVAGPKVEDGVLTITYISDEICFSGGPQTNKTSTITFICDEQNGSLGTPVFDKRSLACENYFEWVTVHACPISSKPKTNPDDTTQPQPSCAYVDPNTGAEFDLSPLRPLGEEHRYVKVEDKDSDVVYYLNVCARVDSDKDDMECGRKGGVCMVKDTSDNTHATAISMGEANSEVVYENGVIALKYTGGDPCPQDNTKLRSSQITFVCNKHTGTGHPRLVLNDLDCTLGFIWETVYACSDVDESVECAFTSTYSGMPYDLSSLAEPQGAWEVTNPTTKYSYYLNVCQGINNIHAGAKGCPVNAGACQTSPTDDNFKPLSLGHVVSRPSMNNEGLIEIRYKHGSKCHDHHYHRQTLILFECDESAGRGAPEFVSESDHCEYVFRWKTKAACPLSAGVVDHAENCRIEHPVTGHVYDFNAMAADNPYKFYRDGYVYHLSMCGPLTDTFGCPPGVALCQTKKTNNDPDGDFHMPLGYTAMTSLMFSGGAVTMVMSGGGDCQMQHEGVTLQKSVVIQFVCDPDHEIGIPAMYSIKNSCEYTLTWHTKLVCYNADSDTKAIEEACKPFTNSADGHRYDLSILNDHHLDGYNTAWNGWKATHAKSTRTEVFYVSVCDPLTPGLCGGGSDGDVGVCKVAEDGTTESIGKATGQTMSVTSDGQIELLYTSDQPCGREGDEKQYVKTLVQLTCTKLSVEPPVYISYIKATCTHNFEWKTRAACKEVDQTGAGCSVTSPTGRIYDLKPLSKKVGQDFWTSEGSETSNGPENLFKLNICAPLEDKTTNPNYNSELVNNKAKPGSGGYDVANGLNLGQSNGELRLVYDQLKLRYSNGDTCVTRDGRHLPASMEITFTCMHLHEEGDLGSPHFLLKSSECVYLFEWETPLACEFPNEAVFGIKHGSDYKPLPGDITKPTNTNPSEIDVNDNSDYDLTAEQDESSSKNSSAAVWILVICIAVLTFATAIFGVTIAMRRRSNGEPIFGDSLTNLRNALPTLPCLPTTHRRPSDYFGRHRTHEDDIVELLDVSDDSGDEMLDDHDVFMGDALGAGSGGGASGSGRPLLGYGLGSDGDSEDDVDMIEG